MPDLGVFRDDFYNAIMVLTNSQQTSYTAAGGTLPAVDLAGASDVYVIVSGQTTAQSYATDTAANIIAQLQNALLTALKNNTFLAPGSVLPPPGVPNLFNLSWTLTFVNSNTSTGTMTITAGTGVTLSGNFTTIAIATSITCIATVTGTGTITITRVMGGTN